MHPKEISISSFSYSLPDDRIANYPLADRGASRLLIYQERKIQEDNYHHIADHIPSNAFMLFNDTRVIQARLLFQKETGGVIEIFCLAPDEKYADITSALGSIGTVDWQCLIGGASKWKKGQLLEKIFAHDSSGKQIILRAEYLGKQTESFIVRLSWSPNELSFAEILHLAGAIPLPPYIKRKAEAGDSERYQTVYSNSEGSVAAPTAGLHFTNEILQSLTTKGIATDYLTLHVGAGTFKPVKAAIMEAHEMHAEYFEVSRSFIEKIIEHVNDPIIPVGTTTLRTLESLYWMGVRVAEHRKEHGNYDIKLVPITQWEAYNAKYPIPPLESLETLLQWMDHQQLTYIMNSTRIIIAPGYKFKLAKALVTNFHQPESTLLLLIAALVGKEWEKIYAYALENNFRFLSYGDGCLLWPVIQ